MNKLSEIADRVFKTQRNKYLIHDPLSYFNLILGASSIEELKEYGDDLSIRINNFRKKIKRKII